MNQNIGISYSVTGQGQVIQAFNAMAHSLDQFMNKMNVFNNVFDKFHTKMQKLSTGKLNFSEGIQGVERMNKSLLEATSSAERLQSQLRATMSAAGALGKGVPAGGYAPVPHAGGRAASQAGLSPYGFMTRWWGLYSGAGAAKHFTEDVGLSKSRQPLLESMKDLSAIGFDAEKRKQTEIMGQQFLRNIWSAGKLHDYMGAVAEVGSAINVNDPMFKGKGVQELNTIAQSAAKMGAVSQMKTEAATKLLMSTMHAQLFQMPDHERGKYESGQLSLGKFGETTAGKISQIIKETSIWGPDVQRGLAYALPSALAKGWNLDTVLAMIGTGKTAGYAGQKFGRALKSILEGETGKLGALALAGGDDPRQWERYKRMTGTQQKALRGKMAGDIGGRMGADPWTTFANIGKWLDKAQERGIDPQQTLGLSKEWIGILRLMGQSGFLEKAKATYETQRKVTGQGATDKSIHDVQQDPGWNTDRMENSWISLKQAMSRSGPMSRQVDAWSNAMDRLTDVFNSPTKIGVKDVLTEIKDVGLHGVVGGISQTLLNLNAELLRGAGLLRKDQPTLQFESLVDAVNGIPREIKFLADFWTQQVKGLAGTLKNSLQGGKDFFLNPDKRMNEKLHKGEVPLKTVPPPEFKNPMLQNITPGAKPASFEDMAADTARAMPIGYGGAEAPGSPGGNAELVQVLQTLAAALSGQQGGKTPVQVFVGNREVEAIVQEAVDRSRMENRTPFGA